MLVCSLPQLRIYGARIVSACFFLGIASSTVGAEANEPAARFPAHSPLPECRPLLEAWRFAESYAATIPHGDVMVGRGDSMLPLYPDRTVIVVQRLPMDQLRPGMTVVFVGVQGRPVAHTLVAKTAHGWTAKGMANDYIDLTRVGEQNYLGTVIRAFKPMTDESAARRSLAASGGAILPGPARLAAGTDQ